MSVPRRVAIVGAGTIGAGWAALFAAHGADVSLVDPDATALDRARASLACARRLGVGAGAAGSLEHADSLERALAGAAWVQESLPESAEIKRRALAALAPHLASDAIVASSASTLTATELGRGLPFAPRFLIAHPLHPVYAVPVVELCGGEETASETADAAEAVLGSLGREPITLRREAAGLIANRLTAALLREAFDLVASGVVTADGLDRVVARGIALGWAASGPLGTEAIGAGPGGFIAFVEHFHAPLSALWRSLASWTALAPERRVALLSSGPDTIRAHAAGECAWAGTLARIERAAGGR